MCISFYNLVDGVACPESVESRVTLPDNSVTTVGYDLRGNAISPVGVRCQS